MRAAWAALASMLRWESTTPFGEPSEPDVNRITAGSSGLRGTRGVLAARRPRSLSAKLDALPQVLEIDDLHMLSRAERQDRSRACPSDEGARRDDRPDLRGGAGREEIRRAGGEVDHRGDAARRHQAEEGHGRAIGSGEHHADRLAFRRERHELGAEDRGAISMRL